MKTIVVTFAGRKMFMEILFPYIKKYEDQIDEYHIYAATKNQEDLDYIEKFSSENKFDSGSGWPSFDRVTDEKNIS